MQQDACICLMCGSIISIEELGEGTSQFVSLLDLLKKGWKGWDLYHALGVTFWLQRNLGDLNVNNRIILKCVLEKWVVLAQDMTEPNAFCVCCRSYTDLQLFAEGTHDAANDTQPLSQYLNLCVQPLSPVFFLLDLLLQLLTLFSIPTNSAEAVD